MQTNETETGDRRWKALSVLRHAFTQEDFGQSLVCRVNHPAYPNGFQEATTALDLLCKINYNFHVLFDFNVKKGTEDDASILVLVSKVK